MESRVPLLPRDVTLFFVAAMVILNIGLVRGSSSIAGYFDLKQSRDALALTVDRIVAENKGLREEIDRIVSSPVYARKVLRDKYHVTEENEDIVFFAD